jgi:Ca2+-transporting ATPase
MNEFYTKSKEDVLNHFSTSKKGLTQRQAQDRLLKYGKNKIKKTHKLRPLKILLSQFNSFLIYLLIIAAVISFAINHKIDGSVITAIIILNSTIGFFQQYRAEKAIIHLKKLIIPKSKVIRNSKLIEVLSEDLVVGDLVILRSGDKVNADCRIISSLNLQANEAILTGESMPIDKSAENILKKTPLQEQKNMLFMGTQVIRGEAKAIVTSTAQNTVFGKITTTLQDIEIQKTPMQKRLDKFSKQVGFIILAMVLIVLLIGLTQHKTDIFLIAIALAVSAIPEGLPAVLAISFAISSIIVSKSNVIIRRLPAVESLGSVSIICSDKTGTITQEEISVQEIFTDNKLYFKKSKNLYLGKKQVDLKNKQISLLFNTSILCNNARIEITNKKPEFIGDPTEIALVSNAFDLNLNKELLTKSQPRIEKFEFDSKRKMMSVLRDNGKNNTIYSKGAVEKILLSSSFEMINNKIKKLSDKRKKEILNYTKKMEEQGLRVLGFAFKDVNKKERLKEKNLVFLGFIGMFDPPRSEVKDAIKQCKRAGIKIKMITGDSAITANAIAKQIGIIGRTISQSELEKITDKELESSINEISIFARITPEQKLRIIKILQKKGETVAVTGDGINDVLALKSADVGVSMGIRGTDVARDVSDIVLIDDNFASIVEGVGQGRKTYDNIKKFTKYFLAVNFSEIILILVALLFFLPLPLLPLQILWINLITDSLPALALVFEKPENVMNTKPRREKSILEGIWKFVIIAGIFTFVVKFFVYLLGIFNDLSIEKTRTIVLTTAILFELFFVYTCRSKKPVLKIGIFKNKWMNYAVIFSVILHLILLYTPLSVFFGVVPLSLNDWILIFPFAISGLVLFEGMKYLKNLK